MMYKRLLLFVTLWTTILTVSAQSACDILFKRGVKYQQKMTIASQRSAIANFEKAKACYDSQAKKDLCTQQVKACRNIIAQLSKTGKKSPSNGGNKTNGGTTVTPVKGNANSASGARSHRDATISLDQNYLKFKGKGGEFKKVKVTCNYTDWKVTEYPKWINCSINGDNEIILEAEQNPSKEERSGIVKVECGNSSATFTVIQEKYKKFIVF